MEWVTKDDGESWEGFIAFVKEDINEPITTILIRTPDLCFDEIIKVYGEPSFLLELSYDAVSRMDVVWPEHGLAYSAKDETPANGVSHDICGGAIIQFPVGTPLVEIEGFALSPLDSTNFVPWHGFGDY